MLKVIEKKCSPVELVGRIHTVRLSPLTSRGHCCHCHFVYSDPWLTLVEMFKVANSLVWRRYPTMWLK